MFYPLKVRKRFLHRSAIPYSSVSLFVFFHIIYIVSWPLDVSQWLLVASFWHCLPSLQLFCYNFRWEMSMKTHYRGCDWAAPGFFLWNSCRNICLWQKQQAPCHPQRPIRSQHYLCHLWPHVTAHIIWMLPLFQSLPVNGLSLFYGFFTT